MSPISERLASGFKTEKGRVFLPELLAVMKKEGEVVIYPSGSQIRIHLDRGKPLKLRFTHSGMMIFSRKEYYPRENPVEAIAPVRGNDLFVGSEWTRMAAKLGLEGMDVSQQSGEVLFRLTIKRELFLISTTPSDLGRISQQTRLTIVAMLLAENWMLPAIKNKGVLVGRYDPADEETSGLSLALPDEKGRLLPLPLGFLKEERIDVTQLLNNLPENFHPVVIA